MSNSTVQDLFFAYTSLKLTVAVVDRLSRLYYDQSKLSCFVKVSNVLHTLIVVKYAHARTIFKQSQLFECGGIYGIDDALQKLKLSNELECGAFIYRMAYETYI